MLYCIYVYGERERETWTTRLTTDGKRACADA